MFSIFGSKEKKTDRLNRRTFVSAGTLGSGMLGAGFLGAGGITLGEYFRLRASAGEAGSPNSKRNTSVILFWLSGGPGHMETWDPKPLAPAEYRGPFGAIPTSVGGIQFSELMPRLAKQMEHLAVVRSVNHGSGDHTKGNHWMLTGFEGPAFNAPDNRQQRRPAMGAAVSRVRGSNAPGMPAYVGVPHLRGGTDNLFHYHAYLGAGYNPFIVNSDPSRKDYRVRNLALSGGLTSARMGDRLGLLRSMDQVQRNSHQSGHALDQHHQQAFDLLTSRRVREAFNIEAEDPKLRETYGSHTFGQSALLARRLVERGVTFVTVNCVPWDHHGSANRYRTEEGSKLLIPPLDAAISGLVDDLRNRNLYEDVLVVAMGEFGRTPRINRYAGRDHWGRTFSVLFGNGRMKMGQTIGRSSPRGEFVENRPVTPQEVVSTIYHHLGIDGEATWFKDRLERPMPLVAEGKPIRELIV